MSDLVYVGTRATVHLEPGQYVVPLGGLAEDNLRDNGYRPVRDETFMVLREPGPCGLFGKIRRMGMSVECLDDKRTKMTFTGNPDSQWAVFSA